MEYKEYKIVVGRKKMSFLSNNLKSLRDWCERKKKSGAWKTYKIVPVKTKKK